MVLNVNGFNWSGGMVLGEQMGLGWMDEEERARENWEQRLRLERRGVL